MAKHTKLKPCCCGCDEFISKPNRYDIYQIIEGNLQLILSPFTDEGIKLYCRECGKELINAEELVTM